MGELCLARNQKHVKMHLLITKFMDEFLQALDAKLEETRDGSRGDVKKSAMREVRSQLMRSVTDGDKTACFDLIERHCRSESSILGSDFRADYESAIKDN